MCGVLPPTIRLRRMVFGTDTSTLRGKNSVPRCSSGHNFAGWCFGRLLLAKKKPVQPCSPSIFSGRPEKLGRFLFLALWYYTDGDPYDSHRQTLQAFQSEEGKRW
jgi:hypothetical protein